MLELDANELTIKSLTNKDLSQRFCSLRSEEAVRHLYDALRTTMGRPVSARLDAVCEAADLHFSTVNINCILDRSLWQEASDREDIPTAFKQSAIKALRNVEGTYDLAWLHRTASNLWVVPMEADPNVHEHVRSYTAIGVGTTSARFCPMQLKVFIHDSDGSELRAEVERQRIFPSALTVTADTLQFDECNALLVPYFDSDSKRYVMSMMAQGRAIDGTLRSVFRSVCAHLLHLHKQGLTHGRIVPERIMLHVPRSRAEDAAILHEAAFFLTDPEGNRGVRDFAADWRMLAQSILDLHRLTAALHGAQPSDFHTDRRVGGDLRKFVHDLLLCESMDAATFKRRVEGLGSPRICSSAIETIIRENRERKLSSALRLAARVRDLLCIQKGRRVHED